MILKGKTVLTTKQGLHVTIKTQAEGGVLTNRLKSQIFSNVPSISPKTRLVEKKRLPVGVIPENRETPFLRKIV
jgi:hypothetical protein